jgi:hypothetical protein
LEGPERKFVELPRTATLAIFIFTESKQDELQEE